MNGFAVPNEKHPGNGGAKRPGQPDLSLVLLTIPAVFWDTTILKTSQVGSHFHPAYQFDNKTHLFTSKNREHKLQ